MHIPAQCIILYDGPYIHHPIYVIKIHVLFFSWYCPGSLIISLSTWFNTLYQSHMLAFINTVYFDQKLYCISWTDKLNHKYKYVSIFRITSWLPRMLHMLNITQADDGQPNTVTTGCWLVSWDTCICWRLPLQWVTAKYYISWNKFLDHH